MNKKCITCFVLLFAFVISCLANEQTDKNETMPVKTFLSNLRANKPLGTWANMTGDIIQKKRLKSGKYKTEQAKIKVGMLFTKMQAVAMIKINKNDLNSDDSEIYKVGQPYNGDPATVISSGYEDASLIGDFGITPGDFTMAFLWWDLSKNADQNQFTSVKTLKCRILNLENPKTKEHVKVFASVDYYSPLKVEWFKENTKEPYRTMIIESFKRDGELGAPNGIMVSGPGWKTKVNLENVKLGYSKDGVPKDLFK